MNVINIGALERPAQRVLEHVSSQVFPRRRDSARS